MIIVITQKRLLALITLPLWLGGGFLTYGGIDGISRIMTPHYCDFPESGCSTSSFIIFPVGVGLLLATAYAFMLNHKRESRQVRQNSPPDS